MRYMSGSKVCNCPGREAMYNPASPPEVKTMRCLIAATAVALLAGCSSSTPYQKIRANGGYDDFKIGNDTYRIRSEVNGFSDISRADDIVLLRSAEVSCLSGYRYFEVVEREVDLESNFKTIVTTIKMRNQPTTYDAEVVMNSLSRKLSVKKTCTFE